MAKEKWDYQKVWDIAVTCSCAKELKEKNSKAYWAARRNDWIKDYTWFKRPDGHHGVWSREEVYQEALKYTCRVEFQRGSRGAYKAALREGWLEDYTWFQKPEVYNKYWTKELCEQRAHNYLKVSDFKENDSAAYAAACKYGWLDDFDWLEKQTVWNETNCRNEALKYTHLSAFERGNASAYQSACRNGWIKDYTWFKRPTVHNKKWDRASCFLVGRQFDTKKAFREARYDAYMAAVRMGWMKEMDWFKPAAIELLEADKSVYCVYVYIDDWNKSCYVGLTNSIKKRDYRHRTSNCVVFNHFAECEIEIPKPQVLKDNLNSEEAQYYEDYYVKYYREQGWNVLNSGATGVGVGSFGGGRVKYTHEKATEIAMQYDTLKDFTREQASCYGRCRKMGWMKEFTWLKKSEYHRHDKNGNYKSTPSKWSFEECESLARLYTSYTEFCKNEKSAAKVARKYGWIDKFDWLERDRNVRSKEECVEISKRFQTNKEFRQAEPTIYAYCVRHKWISEFTWLAKAEPKKSEITDEMIMEEARLFETLEDYKKHSKYHYIADHRKLVKKMTWLKRNFIGNGYWDKTKIIEESRKHDTLKSFRESSKGCYGAAKRLGILDELTWLKRNC